MAVLCADTTATDRVADLDLVAGPERLAAHALAIDLGAVGGLQVLDRPAAVLVVIEHDRMLAAGALVEQRDVGRGVAADQGLAGAELVAGAREVAGANEERRPAGVRCLRGGLRRGHGRVLLGPEDRRGARGA
jgi:hypothetical protein